LVFMGEGSDSGVGVPPGFGGKMFRAFDKKTGKIVGERELPAGVSNSPMTYMVNGKQYILVAVSGRQFPGEYVALAIPCTRRGGRSASPAPACGGTRPTRPDPRSPI